MPLTTPRELFVHELADTDERRADHPRDAAGARAGSAASGGQGGRSRSTSRRRRQQIKNLQQVFKQLGEKPEETTCHAAEGLKKEHEALHEEQPTPEVLEMGNVAGAAKTEHYEIATYTALVQMAQGPRRARGRAAPEGEPGPGEGDGEARRGHRQGTRQGGQARPTGKPRSNRSSSPDDAGPPGRRPAAPRGFRAGRSAVAETDGDRAAPPPSCPTTSIGGGGPSCLPRANERIGRCPRGRSRQNRPVPDRRFVCLDAGGNGFVGWWCRSPISFGPCC